MGNILHRREFFIERNGQEEVWAMIELKGLRLSFQNREILRGIGLTVGQGEVVSVIGPSGTGKTTLLRCLNYLEKPAQGTLSIGDVKVDYARMTNADVRNLRRKSTMVFQSFNLYRNKTVLENVTEGLRVGYGKSRAEAIDIAREQLRFVRMDGHESMYPSELSGGMQQRVGIARALAPKPDVILFDEPTSALDPELAGEVMDAIEKVAALGITMIIVTHEMHFARAVSHKVVYMARGKVVEEGTAEEIFGHPRQEETRTFLRRMRK